MSRAVLDEAEEAGPEAPVPPVEPEPEPAREPVPEFLLHDDAPPPGQSSAAGSPKQVPTDILVGAVDLLHDKWADGLKIDEGIRLTEKEKSLWKQIFSYLIKSLPSKDWPIVIVIVSLVIAESSKVVLTVRVLRERKGIAAPRTVAKPAVPVGAPLDEGVAPSGAPARDGQEVIVVDARPSVY
jgi:hypothetical protein